MKHTKRILAALLCAILILCPFAYAHSGRTDSSGGHHDYQNKSGLGPYHYHHGMGPHLHPNGVCPYASGSSSGGSSGSSASTNPNLRELNYSGISFTIDGEYFRPVNENGEEVEAFIYLGRTYLPVRGIGYALGLNVDFTHDAASTWITFDSGGTVKYIAGKNYRSPRKEVIVMNLVIPGIKVNGERVNLVNDDGTKVWLYSIKGTTYAPVRFVAEMLGLNVEWDAETYTVHLTTGDE